MKGENEVWENYTEKLTPDELAAIAVEFCPDLYRQDPAEGIQVVQKFLRKGDQGACKIALKLNEPKLQKEWEERETKRLEALPLSYEKGVKLITGQGQKLSRARNYFEQFLLAQPGAKKANIVLAHYEKNGFTGTEAKRLQGEFTEWWPQRRGDKKGKQGSVKNPEKDARTKPRPAAIPKMRRYLD
jgi:hypothetical protein